MHLGMINVAWHAAQQYRFYASYTEELRVLFNPLFPADPNRGSVLHPNHNFELKLEPATKFVVNQERSITFPSTGAIMCVS